MNGIAHYTSCSLTLRRPLTVWIVHHCGRFYDTMAFQKKLVSVIQSLYKSFECRVIHNSELTEPFLVETGVRQGCILSPILFSLVIDWLMRSVTRGKHQGIQWTLTSLLEDLDYADDLGLLSHKHQEIQQKWYQWHWLKVNSRKSWQKSWGRMPQSILLSA